MKDWIKVVIILLIIKVIVLVGLFFFSPSLNLESCDDECVWRGYDFGVCAQPSESLEDDEKAGKCVVQNLEHCEKRGLCNCYCRLEGQIIGGETDDHGCYLMAGYNWCESKQKCLRRWEEECPA
jgi:hypothetical protein